MNMSWMPPIPGNFNAIAFDLNMIIAYDASHGERSDGEYSAKGVDFVRQRRDGGTSLRVP